MASRVNTKFLLILAVCTVLVVGILGGLFYLQYRGDADRHIRNGDELMATGEFKEAMNAYGRAVAKNRSNMEYLEKYNAALLKRVPENRDEANDLYGKRIGVLEQAIRYRGDEAGPHLALLQELTPAARLMFDNDDIWRAVWEAADEMEHQAREDDPDRVEAKLYRAIAAFRRSFQISLEELDDAKQDLEDYLSARPNSDAGWSAKIRCLLAISEKLRLEGADPQADELLAEAREAATQARQAVPDGPDVARALALEAIWRNRYFAGAVTEGELDDIIDRMARLATDSGDPLLLLDAAEILGQRPGGRASAIELLQAHVAEHPEAVFHRLTLGNFLYLDGRFEEAEETCTMLAGDEQRLAVSFEARHLPQIRRRAASLLVAIAVERWQEADDEGKRGAYEDLEAAVAVLEGLTVDPENDALYLEADGYLAFARGDFRAAADRFEQLCRDPQTATEKILRYSARSLEEINEYGLAYERLKTLAALKPKSTQYLYACATSAYSLRRYEESERWLLQLLEVDAGHEEGRRMLSLVAVARRRGGDEAVDLDPVARALTEAEAAMAEGKVESARSTLLAALETDEDNWPLNMALLRVEITAGRQEQARAYVEDLRSRFPANRFLLQIAATLDSDNRVDAIEQYVESLGLPEEERVVTVLVHLESLANMQRGRAAQHEFAGHDEDAAAATALAEQADEAARGYLEEAERLAPGNKQLQEYLFRQALRDRDWVRAEELVQQARESNTDLADGALFAGQLALQKEEYDEAIRWLRDATRKVPYSSGAWRGLAIAYQNQGNFGEARRAFEQSYTNNPNDVDTVQRYVDLLMRTGDRTAALRIMRTAHRLVPDDLALRERWLQLETIGGDSAMAFKKRREIYLENPTDSSNAKQLATFLATAKPGRDLILDQQGAQRFSTLQWDRLSPLEQQQQILRTKALWFNEAQAILDTLERQQEARSLSITALRALLLREQGLIDEGEAILDEYITATPEDEVDSEMLLALGLYQMEIGRQDDAVETMNRARQYQDPVAREADVALGELFFSEGEYEDALQAYSRAVQVNPGSGSELRIIECLARMGRFQEAERRLQTRMDDGENGYPEQMLAAAIYNGFGEALHREGRHDEADRMFDRRDAAWGEAERFDPSNHLPHVQRAVAKRSAFYRAVQAGDDQNPTLLLEDALAALDRADEIRADDVQTSLTRVAILQDMGDNLAAVNELSRLLQVNPDEIAARRRLVQLHNQLGELQDALAVVDDGARRNPTLTVWHELRGDLHLGRVLQLQQAPTTPENQRTLAEHSAKAAAAYRQAVQLDPRGAMLGKLLGSLLNSRPPGTREAVQLIGDHAELLDVQPGERGGIDAAMLKSLYARALDGEGKPDQAKQELAEAYQLFRAAPDVAVAVAAMNQWYRGVTTVFAGRPIEEIERFLKAQAPPAPAAPELSWLAGLYAGQGTSESNRRALELQREAVDVYDAEDERTLAGLYYNLAIFLVLDRQYQAAVEPFKQAIEADPTHRRALNNYAYLLADELRRPEEALPHALRAVDLLTPVDPDDQHSDVLDTLGWIHYLLGDSTKAESVLRQSMGKAVTSSNCYHLAAVLAEMDKLDAARTYLDRAAELRPDPRTKAEIDSLADDIRTRRK